MASTVSVNLSLRSPRRSSNSTSSGKSKKSRLKRAFRTIIPSYNKQNVAKYPSEPNNETLQRYPVAEEVIDLPEGQPVKINQAEISDSSVSNVFQTQAEKPLQEEPGIFQADELEPVQPDHRSEYNQYRNEQDYQRSQKKVKRQKRKQSKHHDIKWILPSPSQQMDKHNTTIYGKLDNIGEVELRTPRDYIVNVSKNGVKTRMIPDFNENLVHENYQEFINKPSKSRKSRAARGDILAEEPKSPLAINKENVNITAKTNSRTSKWKNRYFQLEHEKLELENQVHQLQLRLQRDQSRNTITCRIKSLARENRNLKDDIDILKSVVRRLNKEIRTYQERLKASTASNERKIPVYVSSSATSTHSNGGGVHTGEDSDHERHKENDDEFWFRNCKTKLNPLLLAYDEIIKEKNEILKDYELTMETFKHRMMEVVTENESLHKSVVDGAQKGSISTEDWQYLYDNATVVLQENDLLHEQVQVLKRKVTFMQNAHDERDSKVKAQFQLMDDERMKIIATKTQLETHCKLMAEQITKLSQALQARIPVEEHEKAVQECQRLFEELKRNYHDDRNDLQAQISTAEKENGLLKQRLLDADAEKARLGAQIQNLESSVADHTTKLDDMYAKMTEASKTKQTTATTVSEIMKLAKAVMEDRDTLEQSLNDQKNLNYRIMNLRSQESELVSQLREKIRSLEVGHNLIVQDLSKRTSDAETLLASERHRYEVEVQRLLEMMQQIERDSEVVKAEKKQLEHDLQTVWKVTTSNHSNVNVPKKPDDG